MEERFYAEEYNHSPLENESEEQKKQKKQIDPLISVIIFHGIITAGVIVFLLITKLFFGNMFSEINSWYDNNVKADTNVNEVLYNSSNTSEEGGPFIPLTLENNDFVFPVNSNIITSKFGIRNDPFTNKIAFHGGIDIAVKEGSKIYSSISGRVEKVVLNTEDYGNYVIIKKGNVKTLYAHCSKILVKENDVLNSGEVIALSGNTGRSTGPHLHFEVRVNDSKIDPLPLLQTKENK